MWSERYDRQAEDIFAIQDEIAAAIAGKLKVSLDAHGHEPLNRARTDNLDAYQHYLRGRFSLNQRGSGLAEGMAHFPQALSLDSDYGPAHAGLGDGYALLSFYGFLPAHEAMSKARAAARWALDETPALAEAHATLLFIACMYDWDWHSVRREYDRAMAIDPRGMTGIQWYALYLATVAGDITW